MRNLGKNLLLVFLGIVISIITNVTAEVVISSGSVSYSNTTVSAALDELFSAVDINDKIGTTNISGIGNGTITGAISSLYSDYKIKISSFISGSSLNTDYTIPKPDDIVLDEVCMLISLSISNTSYSDPNKIDLDTLFDINYIGVLKKNNIYQVTNSNCLGKPARATFVCWSK